jgi:hypothetical protein
LIFYWLRRALYFVGWLFREPDKRQFARIDRNLRCPICGATDGGRLRCVARQAKEGKTIGMKPLCQHTCLECGARFYEAPVLAVDSALVSPAIARDQIEEREDIQLRAEEQSVNLARRGLQ